MVAASNVVGLGLLVERWVRASFIYRWLTAEPEPEVIVIDLRDTLTVGPFVTALDDGIEMALGVRPYSKVYRRCLEIVNIILDAPLRVASLVALVAVVVSLLLQLLLGAVTVATAVVTVAVAGLAAIGTRIDVPWAELRETRAVRLLVAAFEPPPPPEEFESTTSGFPDGSDAPDAGASSAAEPTEDEQSDGNEAAPPRTESGE